MRVGIVGCGLIGRRRAEVVTRSSSDQLVIVADLDAARAEETARANDCLWTADWGQLVGRDDLEAIVVSTTNNSLLPVTVAALEAGKHVLCEKPLGRDCFEAERMVATARDSGRLLKTGFNHRHHPAVYKAHEMFAQGAIGDPMFIRCCYGHGGRPRYDKEWRADRSIAGGGELLDQGIHAIDLFRWFLGDFAEVFGFAPTYFWTGDHSRSECAVDDNVFALFRGAGGRVASLQASWTQWKNLFSFEVFGKDGYLNVQGLGGSYGAERLVWGRRRPESGPPDEQHFEFAGGDISWRDEWLEFTGAISDNRRSLGDGNDGWQAMRLVHALYESSRTGLLMRLSDG